MLNEIRDPPVTDATNPILPLEEIRGCACLSRIEEEGRETLRTWEILVRWSLPCATTKLSSRRQTTKVAGFFFFITVEGSQWIFNAREG